MIFQRRIPKWRLALFVCDSALILAALFLVQIGLALSRSGLGGLSQFDAMGLLPKMALILVLCQISMYLNGLYDYKSVQSRGLFVVNLLQAIGIAYILLSLIYLVFKSVSIGHTACILGLPVILLFLFLWRSAYRRFLVGERFAERVLILGSSPLARALVQHIGEVKDCGYKVVAVVAEDNPGEEFLQGTRYDGSIVPLSGFPSILETAPADRIVVALRDQRGKLPINSLLDCRFRGIPVQEARDLYETLTGKVAIEDLRPSWFIFSDGFVRNKFTLRLKRVTDLVVAALGLLLAAPLMAIIAVLIKLDSKGPVFYTQDRVGEAWKDFTLYKFRSMVKDAEALGPQWAKDRDPRVTRVGRLIRKYRLDELPQLINVLKGDLSMVGPRPERRVFVTELAKEIPFYPQRLCVKPGVTGWAQIKFHYGASKDDTVEKLQYDLYYMKHMSLLFDLSILLDTVAVVLSGKGAK